MKLHSHFAGSAVALLAIAGVAGAQTQFNNIKKVSSLKHATYDLKTGELSLQKSGEPVCWSNTDTSGFFSLPGSTGGIDEWIACGGLATSNEAAGCPGGSNIIDGFTFGYASNVLSTSVGGPGVTIATTFYAGAVCCSTAGTPVSGLLFSGLPGATAPGTSVPGWLISVCLSGGFNFCLDDTVKFGFGLIFFSGGTGPLLCYAGNGLGGPDGNCQSDFFGWYSPPAISGGTLLGCFFFGGVPFDFSSWYLTMQEATVAGCAKASTTVEPFNDGAPGCGAAANPMIYTGTTTVIGTLYVASVTSGFGAGGLCLVVYGIGPGPDLKLALAGICQEVEVPIVPPFSLACSGTFVAGVTTCSFPLPKDTALCGIVASSQAIGVGIGAGGFRLSNGLNHVLGVL